MRQITEDTRELVKHLNQPISFWNFFSAKKKDIGGLLSKIQDRCEPAVIPDILQFVVFKDENVSQKAATVIDFLLKCLSVNDIIWFGRYLRQRTAYLSYYGNGWHNLKPQEIDFYKYYPDCQVSLLILLSLHNNGYIREEAVRRLGLIEDGREIPYILLRLNDWVSQVRVAAYEVITNKINLENASHFIASICMVASLARFKRFDHSCVIDSIHSLLTKREVYGSIKDALRSDDVYTRRELYKIFLKPERLFFDEIVERGTRDSDIIVRFRTIKSLKSISDLALIKQYLASLEDDPFMPNRREVLSLYLDLFPDVADEKLYNALFDHHPSIRQWARYYLSQRNKTDFPKIYREEIKEPSEKKLVGTISGLGEVGSKDDARLIVGYTAHRMSKVRKLSIRAIVRLDSENHRDLFKTMVNDDSPRVSIEAALALIQCGHQTIFAELWDLFERTEKSHVRKSILMMASRLSKWESVFYFIKAIASPDEAISMIGDNHLNRWLYDFNRSYIKPTREQKCRIENAIQMHEKSIGRERKELIEFNMKTF